MRGLQRQNVICACEMCLGCMGDGDRDGHTYIGISMGMGCGWAGAALHT